MSDKFIIVIGTLAAFASMGSFVPQAWRIVKTRDTGSLSASTYFLTVLAFALWCGYGFLLGAWPLVASNAVCLVLSTFIFVMTLLPQSAKDKVADAAGASD